jgi:hypothetical protein
VLEALRSERLSRAAVAKALGRDKSDGSIRRVLQDLEEDGAIDRDGGLWGVVTKGWSLGGGQPDHPLENRIGKPNQGVANDWPPEAIGNPSNGCDPDAEFDRIEAKFPDLADDRCNRCDGLLGYDEDAQETRCVNGHRQVQP